VCRQSEHREQKEAARWQRPHPDEGQPSRTGARLVKIRRGWAPKWYLRFVVRHSWSLARRVVLGSILALIAMMAMSASAEAYTVGFELSSGSLPAIQIPSILSFQQGIVSHPTSSAYGRKGGHPTSASELTITKVLDKSSTSLLQATAKGLHYKSGSLIWQGASGTIGAMCLTDVFPTSYALGGHSDTPTESVSFGYGKIQTEYGPGASCDGSSAPPVETTLIGLNRSSSSLTVRVDCLTRLCRGDLAVSVPKAACPEGGSKCTFTGGVRVGLNGGGKVKLNGDGSAYTGGVKLSSAGAFSMGDGSVRVLRLAVPPQLGKWLAGHSHATLGTIIVVRGLGKAIVERELLGAPAKIDAGIPSLTASEPPAGGGGGTPEPPKDLPQSLAVTECSSPVVGTPTMVSIKGSLSPARSGAKVTLTYTPVTGPSPMPAPIADTVATTAAGTFGKNFDRRQGGNDYGWSVVAGIAEGGGYAAASSPPCAVPIP
jgi:type VI protein secretion system component Hcp